MREPHRARRQAPVPDPTSHSLHATCTVGLGARAADQPGPERGRDGRLDALRRGRERGGNQIVTVDRADNDTRVQAYDQIWVKHIKAALMENRFRLVQQPIAALGGGDQKMFDVAIRMLDDQGKEVLPSEFLPAAERNDLMKNIDRWVIGASLSFAGQAQARHDVRAPVARQRRGRQRCCSGSRLQLKSTLADPQRLCLQITEEVASKHLPQTQQLVAGLRERGLRFALEHFGTGRDSQRLIGTLPMDFVKIDGSLMQGLSGKPGAAAARARHRRGGRPARRPDRRRAHRGRQHHGGGLAARRAVHSGLFRARARRGRAQVVSGGAAGVAARARCRRSRPRRRPLSGSQ